MSRLFKQIQQTQAKEQTFIESLKIPFKQEQKFNVIPCVCIVLLLFCFVVAYFCVDQNTISQSSLEKESSINTRTKTGVKNVQQSLPRVVHTETPGQEDLKSKQYEEVFKLAENESEGHEKIVMHPMQWNFRPLKNWVQEHLKNLSPEIQGIKNRLKYFAYLDIMQPIPEKAISSVEKERLELIQRFLKRFKIEAVRIDGAYSRVMANGQNYYVNTLVSQQPRLKLTGVTSQEMIFKDEYNQEYRKEISQND